MATTTNRGTTVTQPPNPGPYPYQPPPQYAPPPVKRKGKAGKIVLLGCGIPLGLLVLLIIISVATSGGRQAAKDGFNAGLGSGKGAPASAPAQPVQATTTPPPPPPPPKVYTGRGDSVVPIDAPKGLAIVVFECPKCTSNTVVKSDGPESLLVNTIGAYTGKRWINAHAGGVTTELTVKATGSWTITVGGLDLAHRSEGTTAVDGSGDDVVVFPGKFRTAAVANKGPSNFVVQAISATGAGLPSLAVNEIGSYEGTVKLAGPGAVQVTSSGNWTITPAG